MKEYLKQVAFTQKKLYSLVRFAETDELHIFLSLREPVSRKCVPADNLSICKEMSLEDAGGARKECLDEADMRLAAATIGREVCGNCIRHLYVTYPKRK